MVKWRKKRHAHAQYVRQNGKELGVCVCFQKGLFLRRWLEHCQPNEKSYYMCPNIGRFVVQSKQRLYAIPSCIIYTIVIQNVWPSHQIWWRLRSWPKSFRILLRHICFYRGSPYVPTWVQPCLHVRDSRHCSRIVYYLSTLVQHLQLTMETLLRKGRRGLLPISYTQTLNDLLARWTNLAVVLVISKIII